MDILTYLIVTWFIVGCFTVYTFCWMEEDVVEVRHLPMLAGCACLGPIILIFWLVDKFNESNFSTKVVFDFRRGESDDD